MRFARREGGRTVVRGSYSPCSGGNLLSGRVAQEKGHPASARLGLRVSAPCGNLGWSTKQLFQCHAQATPMNAAHKSFPVYCK
jgi:hypothetical protein